MVFESKETLYQNLCSLLQSFCDSKIFAWSLYNILI